MTIDEFINRIEQTILAVNGNPNLGTNTIGILPEDRLDILAASTIEEASKYLLAADIPKYIIDFGLASENNKGQIIDFFAERLIFPIIESQNNVLGFGGRILSDKNPKYVYTKKNLLFDKGSVLYGLDTVTSKIY